MNCKDEFDRLNGIASITKGAQSLVDGIERVLRENLDKDKAIAELSRRLTNLEVENKELRLEIGRIDRDLLANRCNKVKGSRHGTATGNGRWRQRNRRLDPGLMEPVMNEVLMYNLILSGQ